MKRTNRARAIGAAVLGLTVGLGACDTESLIELQDPDLITLPVVQDTANIESLRNGAVSEFARALTGPAASNQTPGIVGISATLTDEAWYASSFNTMKDIDERAMFDTNGALEDVYHDLHRARNLAEETAAIYESSRPNSPDRALLKNVAAYSYILFAENWCSGVPFSRAPLGSPIELSPGISKMEMLQEALTRFQEAEALAESAGSDQEANLARVGQARAYQNMGDLTQAAAAVADVPDDFKYEITYTDDLGAGQNNGFWFENISSGRTSVATDDGVNGIHFFDRGDTPDGANTIDPRVPVDSAGTGIGSSVPLYEQYLYDEPGSNVVIASGIEARLIEAEALLPSDAPGAFAILNDLRATVDLAALAAPTGDFSSDLLTLYEERAFWLYLTAHRQGDLRRLIATDARGGYGLFTQDEVYPIGQTIFGSPRGSDVVFPVPQEELNNPEWEGCEDFQA